MLITIFTPTFNRAYRLPALYQSILSQNFTDFEWLIVDDGSTDNTEELVRQWTDRGNINILYIRQPNGGKHRAINRGVAAAEGILFFIVDSDDILPSDSLERIAAHYDLIKGREGFGGLCGMKAYYDGRIVGDKPDFGIIECDNFDIRYKYKLKGDMAEVFYTSVLKDFPFPDIPGEKFCPEGLIWNRIATRYKTHYFSEIIYLCEYLEDGLTSRITKIRKESPVASSMTYADLTEAPIPFLYKLRAAINYWRFAHYTSDAPSVSPLWVIAKPLAAIMISRDRNV